MKRLISLLVVLLVTSTAFGAVKFYQGMSMGVYSDSRISGMANEAGWSCGVGDYEAGIIGVNAVLAATDPTDGTTCAVTETINAMRFARIITPAITAGIEWGTMNLVTTTPGAGTLDQGPIALYGLFGTYGYESKGKDVSTSVSANVGYRMSNITAGTPDNGATWGDTNVITMNALSFGLSIAIGF